MALTDIVLPRMGEGVEEATVTRWFVEPGQKVQEDEPIVEIATDKVDSEISSPVSGVVKDINFNVNDIAMVGDILAVISTESGSDEQVAKEELPVVDVAEFKSEPVVDIEQSQTRIPIIKESSKQEDRIVKARFLSPLVQSIIQKEGVTPAEVSRIVGTGREGRITKDDIHSYLNQKASKDNGSSVTKKFASAPKNGSPKVNVSSEDEIVVMDRMRKLIADHMLMSKQVSPHVTSVVEADVTNIVLWRNRNKEAFMNKYGVKLTYMPLFTEAVAKAIRDFPGVNASVDGDKIILRKNINVGIAVVLPSGNLIVPVIKQTDSMNITELAQKINLLADKSRNNNLLPEDIQGGTFTLTNVGTFGNIMGTPIINQPQVAILAVGVIEKKPAVMETPTGDVIAIRHKMYLSLSYDHRVVDGALGGGFLKRVSDYLEGFDIDTKL